MLIKKKLQLLVLTSLFFQISCSSLDKKIEAKTVYRNSIAKPTIRCSYNPVSNVKNKQYIIETKKHLQTSADLTKAEYQINGHSLIITANKGIFKASLDQYPLNVMTKKGRYISLTYLEFSLPEKSQDLPIIASAINLKNLNCRASRTPVNNLINITDETQHVLIHPHPVYDPFGEGAIMVTKKLAKYRNTVVLLDFPYLPERTAIKFYNLKESQANFPDELYQKLKNYENLTVSIPNTARTFVSQAGDNYYQLSRIKHNIIYSGGNFNYCMFTNTKNLIDSYLNSPKTKELKISFLMDTLTVQSISLFGADELAVPKTSYEKTRLLSKTFSDMGKHFEQTYLKAYFSYIVEHIKKNQELFRSVVIKFKYLGKEIESERVGIKNASLERDLVLNIEIL